MKINKSLLMLAAISTLTITGCSKPGSGNTPDNPDGGNVTEDGTKEHPYLISTKQDLIDLQQKVNADDFSGFVKDVNEAPHYRLTADIDLGGMEWEAIGNTLNEETFENIFSANFDGDGHTIKNFKITEYNTDIDFYGLFGIFHGYMHDLKVTDFNITLNPATVYASNYIGGIVAYGEQSAFENLHAEGSISYKISEPSFQTVLGGAIGMTTASQIETEDGPKGAVVFNRFITTDVDIENTSTKSFNGGVFGYVSTSSGQAIDNISFVSANGSLKTAGVTGGITSRIDKYTTITHAIVTSQRIEGKSVVGGITGIAPQDTVISNSLIAAREIVAAEETQSREFVAGTMFGACQGFDLYETKELATLAYNTLVLNTTKVKLGRTAKDDPNGTPRATSTQLTDKEYLKENLGFGDAEFIFADKQYPQINIDAEIDYSQKVDVTFQTNMEGTSHASEKVSKYDYDRFSNAMLSKEGYTFKGWYYDEAQEIAYRFYLPMMEDTTLYGGWAKYSDFAGTYASMDNNGMILQFDDKGHLMSYYKDHTYSTGTYAFYDDHLYFEIDSSIAIGGWPETCGFYDETLGQLTFTESSNSSVKYNYKPANELIGYYKKGNMALDFMTHTYAVLNIPSADGMIPTNITYKVNNDGTITGKTMESKPQDVTINLGSDAKVSITIGETTYEGFEKVPFVPDYSNNPATPWVGKTYNGAELNENLGVTDVKFQADGVAILTASRGNPNNHEETVTRPIDAEKSDLTKGNITWSWNSTTGDIFKREIIKNADNEFYTYKTTDIAVDEERETIEEKVICTTLKRIELSNGTVLYQGKHNFYGTGSNYFLEFTLSKDKTQITFKEYSNLYNCGGYFVDGNDVYVKAIEGYNFKLTYKADLDVFVAYTENKNGSEPYAKEHHLLAPYEINGCFKFEGVEALKDTKLYSYVGHTYLLDAEGNVSVIEGDFNNFANDTNVNITINGVAYSFHVTNLFGDNILTKI